MIRPTILADTPHLLSLAKETGVFIDQELENLADLLPDDSAAEDPQLLTFELEGRPIAFAHFTPADMTEKTWYLYWLLVAKEYQGQGVGLAILRYLEEEVRRLHQGRNMLVELSSHVRHDRIRYFLEHRSYQLLGVIKDFYRDGEDLLVYRKRLEH